MGKSKAEGKSILLSAKDAAWIYEHCKEGTKVSVIKGRKNDELSVSPEAKVSTYKYCGWDPTDPDKNNPYLKIKNGAVVKGLSTITTERGQEPDYLGNIIALKDVYKRQDKEIMAVKHRDYPIYGLQFHPESVMTPEGKTILSNFLKI